MEKQTKEKGRKVSKEVRSDEGVSLSEPEVPKEPERTLSVVIPRLSMEEYEERKR